MSWKGGAGFRGGSIILFDHMGSINHLWDLCEMRTSQGVPECPGVSSRTLFTSSGASGTRSSPKFNTAMKRKCFESVEDIEGARGQKQGLSRKRTPDAAEGGEKDGPSVFKVGAAIRSILKGIKESVSFA